MPDTDVAAARRPDRSTTPVVVSKLGYVQQQTTDLDRMIDYYTTVMRFGLVDSSATEAYLTPSFDHHAVVVTTGDEPKARTTVGFEIFEDLSDAHARLRAAGYEVQRRSDIAPGLADALVLAEPLTGTTVHLYDRQTRSEIDGRDALRPTKLGHVAAFVPQLRPLQDFYQGLLGFKWSDTIGDFFVFLRCNADHHAANFMASATRTGQHHIAYEMRDLAHLQTMLDHLAANGYRLEWGPGRHGAGHNIFTYHHDPDGNLVELFTQLDLIVDEAKGYFEPRPWHTEFPQYPKTWEVDAVAVNSWGPINPKLLEH